jgi:hypothetical protein
VESYLGLVPQEMSSGETQRRGRKVAVVALARRLAGILYALVRDGTNYTPMPTQRLPVTRTAVAAA